MFEFGSFSSLFVLVGALILAFVAFKGFAWLVRWQSTSNNSSSNIWSEEIETPPIDLKAWLGAFSEAGLNLEPGITEDDVLYSWDETWGKKDPCWQLYFIFGSEVEREPWGRRFCNRVLNLDMERIEEDDSYAEILAELAGLTGQSERLSDVKSTLDWQAGHVEIHYAIDGKSRKLTPKFNHDWADPVVLETVMRELETALDDGGKFYWADNGQSAIIAYLQKKEFQKLGDMGLKLNKYR